MPYNNFAFPVIYALLTRETVTPCVKVFGKNLLVPIYADIGNHWTEGRICVSSGHFYVFKRVRKNDLLVLLSPNNCEKITERWS